MSYYAPDAIKAIRPLVDKVMPIDEFYITEGGPEGEGYHHSREDLDRRFGKGEAYSVQHELDQGGDPKAASAFDFIFEREQDLFTCTRRFLNAAKAKDERVYKKLRDFGGTLDGEEVTAFNITEQRYISMDDGHLWHWHGSIHRQYATDKNACLGFAEVAAGVAPGTYGWKSDKVPTAPFKVGDKLETKVATHAYYNTAGKIRALVAKGYDVTVKDQHYVDGQWWVESAVYFYKAARLQKRVAPTPVPPAPAPKVINKYIVNTDKLNVRSSGSTASDKNIKGVAERGQKLQGYEVNEGGRVWVVDGAKSYFARQYLVKYVTYQVNTDLLNVRSAPKVANNVVKQVPQGTWVLVTETKDGWAKDIDGKYYSLEYLKKV